MMLFVLFRVLFFCVFILICYRRFFVEKIVFFIEYPFSFLLFIYLLILFFIHLNNLLGFKFLGNFSLKINRLIYSSNILGFFIFLLIQVLYVYKKTTSFFYFCIYILRVIGLVFFFYCLFFEFFLGSYYFIFYVLGFNFIIGFFLFLQKSILFFIETNLVVLNRKLLSVKTIDNFMEWNKCFLQFGYGNLRDKRLIHTVYFLNPLFSIKYVDSQKNKQFGLFLYWQCFYFNKLNIFFKKLYFEKFLFYCNKLYSFIFIIFLLWCFYVNSFLL